MRRIAIVLALAACSSKDTRPEAPPSPERAKLAAEHRAELARWTPQLHAGAKALVETAFPSGRAAVEAAVASKHRHPGFDARDRYRHPVDTLALFGLEPAMTVLEIGPGEGWYTELIAPVVAKRGKLLVTTGDPDGPPDARSTLAAQRTQLMLETSPELYAGVERIVVDANAPKLGRPASVDLIVLARGLHNLVNDGVLDRWLAELHATLKHGGALGIEQHRAAPGAEPAASAKRGYLPERWVIEQVLAAGFELGGISEVNANPLDTRDYPDGVWVLPPTYKLGDRDRAKYAAIGESDRMTLKFIKR
jgi:predicted methyltransferase